MVTKLACCCAGFAEKFTTSGPRIIRMEREKIAYKRDEQYTLALLGGQDEADSALRNQLDRCRDCLLSCWVVVAVLRTLLFFLLFFSLLL